MRSATIFESGHHFDDLERVLHLSPPLPAMATGRPSFPSMCLWLCILSLLSFTSPTSAADTNTTYVTYTEPDGTTVYLRDDRRPALYTGDFGDCQGDSLINVTRFDAAYYVDNQTVLFHLGGNSALTNESLMLYIGVYAYGEQRFELTFNPCNANINSLCPLNSSVPIEASGIIPVAPSDVANIPSIAFSIPDFEGQAILRIFANSTESQIACYSAVVTNGSSFSHPAAIGSVLGVFAAVALLCSVALAIYGHNATETRKHYAHSVSVFVVFAVFQHIFFTGALSMNWPSVLVAFWSNYAWASGMIYSEGMQNTINQFIGSNKGNISMVGSAPSGENQPGLGGGYQISQIYRRSIATPFQAFDGIGTTFRPRALEHALSRRDALVNSTTGYSWYGSPVRPGLPLPGNYSGFAGTLAQENIPASNAFLTGFLWLLILIVCVAAAIVALKWLVEGLARVKVVKTGHFDHFRSHWIAFTAAVVLRTFYIAFFMLIFLTLFQFTLGGSSAIFALAAVIFVIIFLGMLAVTAYALFYRLRHQAFKSEPDRLHIEPSKLGFSFSRASKITEQDQPKGLASSVPWWRMHFVDKDGETAHVHDDTDYMTKFGWLSARFRRSKWWFFSFWLIYEFVRACFYGGAAGHPLTQVFGLLVVEFIALVAIILMKPFESNRLNLLLVYLLGFSKVVTVALSSAFDPRFGLDRILCTVIGVVIIVIQGVLTICVMIAIVIGAISSYMSLSRYREREEFKPVAWQDYRERYFTHVDQKATDQPKPRPAIVSSPEKPKEPYFQVSAVRREPKIEDEDPDLDILEEEGDGRASIDRAAAGPSIGPVSRTQSIRSHRSHSNLPYGAQRHRASWSTLDFQQAQIPTSGLQSRMSVESVRDAPKRDRAASLRSPSRDGPSPLPQVKTHSRRNTITRPQVKRNSSVVNEETEGDHIMPA